jgi:hypothetical protein
MENIMKKAGWILLTFILLASCALQNTINDYYPTYCILEPFEDYYAQVTFKSSAMIYPKVYTENGENYFVAVINGFENPEDALELKGTLEIESGIMAINSNAFARAENITKVILPSSCQSLGNHSLPPKITDITLDPEAAKDLAIALTDLDALKTITLVGTGITNIKGEFNNLEEVKIVGSALNVQAYWPSLPLLPDVGELYFQGWFDSFGNRIIGGNKIEMVNSVTTVNDEQYYLYGIATPKYAEAPPKEPIEDEELQSSGFGFIASSYLVATEEKYEFIFTDYGEGKYGIKPKVTENVVYEIIYDAKKRTDMVLEEGEWMLEIEDVRFHTFACFYNDSRTGEVLGYSQITFRNNV